MLSLWSQILETNMCCPCHHPATRGGCGVVSLEPERRRWLVPSYFLTALIYIVPHPTCMLHQDRARYKNRTIKNKINCNTNSVLTTRQIQNSSKPCHSSSTNPSSSVQFKANQITNLTFILFYCLHLLHYTIYTPVLPPLKIFEQVMNYVHVWHPYRPPKPKFGITPDIADNTDHNTMLIANNTDHNNTLIADNTDLNTMLIADNTDHNTTLIADNTDHNTRLIADNTDHNTRLIADNTDHNTILIANNTDYNIMLIAGNADHKSQLPVNLLQNSVASICNRQKKKKHTVFPCPQGKELCQWAWDQSTLNLQTPALHLREREGGQNISSNNLLVLLNVKWWKSSMVFSVLQNLFFFFFF